MNSDIGDVLARFPEQAVQIRERAEGDERFQEVCADYTECIAALRRLRVEGTADVERICQYDELRVELERELEAVLFRPHASEAKPRVDIDPSEKVPG